MKQFIKQHKYHLMILVILLVITGISGYQYSKIYNEPININEIQNEDEQNNGQKIDNIQQTPDNNEQTPNSNYQITNQETILTSTTENIDSNLNTTTYDLKLKTEGLQLTTYELKANDYPISSSTTVYDLMQFASADSRQPFLFETKDYGSMGLFIESINGLKNNNKTGKYWIYYVNDQSAQVGISNYIIKPNDIITWKYTRQNDIF